MAPSTPSTLFLAPPLAHSSRSRNWHSPVFQPIINRGDSAISSPLLRLEASASPLDVPIGGAPVVVLAAIILAVAAQSWINSLLGGDRGLGAFLSDGTGFNKSGFKPRRRQRRPITDERTVPGDGDASGPLGSPDPLPWLKLPEFDYVDVAGQPTRPKRMEATSGYSDESKVVERLEFLREQMKMAVERGNMEDAKRIEDELERIMKEQGFDFST